SFEVVSVDLTLVIISAVLYVLYFLSGKNSSSRNVGFAVGASVLLVIGIHSIVVELWNIGKLEGVLFFLLLGTAFWIVRFLHYRTLEGINWTIYTAISLYIFAGINFFSEYLNRGFLQYIWAILFILLGLYIIFKDKIKGN
ncbi:MAG: hypothetical protein ACQEQF_10300, partial [Bacillota bacterium]